MFTPAAPWGSTALGVSRAKLCREETEGDDEAVDDAQSVHGLPRSAAEACPEPTFKGLQALSCGPQPSQRSWGGRLRMEGLMGAPRPWKREWQSDVSSGARSSLWHSGQKLRCSHLLGDPWGQPETEQVLSALHL